jgi:hypothetical protein
MALTISDFHNTIHKEDSFQGLREKFAAKSANDMVVVQNWQAVYGINGLTQSCSVKAKDSHQTISSIGLVAYSSDRSTLYCSQYTTPTNTNTVIPAVSTAGIKLQVGGQIVGVLFGYIGGAEFFFEQF